MLLFGVLVLLSLFHSKPSITLGFEFAALIQSQKVHSFLRWWRDCTCEDTCGLFIMEDTLTIEECREYLGDTNLTDKQIAEMRDSLCVLIDKSIDVHFQKKIQ